MSSVAASELKSACRRLRTVVDQPQWDVEVFCRFLSERLPGDGEIDAAEVARQAEELIADLKQGVDRHTGEPFSTSMLDDRGDLVYNYIRTQLVSVGRKLGSDAFAAELETGVPLVEPPPPPPPEPKEPAAAPAKADAPAAATPAAAADEAKNEG